MKTCLRIILLTVLLIAAAAPTRAARERAAAHHGNVYDIKFYSDYERRLAYRQLVRSQQEFDELNAYTKFKISLEDSLGLHYGFDISYNAQRVTHGGKQTSIQGIYSPFLSWDVFDTAFGSGKIDLAYGTTQYWGTEAVALSDRAEVAIPINGSTSNGPGFSQLTYTHTMPGDWSWLSLTLGHYGIGMFTGLSYTGQQVGLINNAKSKNTTASYAGGGIGAYVEINPSEQIRLDFGYQDANNIDSERIYFDTAFGGEYTGFASIRYKPEIKGLGAGRYGVLIYYQPSVKEQPGYSTGWSLSAEQKVAEKWAAFARANASTREAESVKRSLVLGGAYLNPLDRNQLDVITFAATYNRLNKDAYGVAGMKPDETIFEAQWVWGISNWMTITPDLQLYPRSALSPDKKWIAAMGVRVTVLL